MRCWLLAPCLALAAVASAEEAYLGLHISGKKIGYSTYVGSKETREGVSLHRSDSQMVMKTSMMGSDLDMKMDSSSWSDAKGRPVKMVFRIESGGRVQTIDADFNASTVKLSIDNSGEISKSELPLPTGAPIVDDALGAFLVEGVKPGAKKDFFVLDPTTASFIKNTAEIYGPRKTQIGGIQTLATLVTIHDPRADTLVYLNAKGEFLKAEGPIGIEMLPQPKAVALDMSGKGARVDIAESTSLRPDSVLSDPAALRTLTLLVTGRNLKGVPSDAFQTVSGSADRWTLSIHPPAWKEMQNPSVASLRASLPAWTKPSMHMNCDSNEWKGIIQPAVKGSPNLRGRVKAIHDLVYGHMKPNAGIGVLRDASEVYRTGEGVCRDYAVLTGTLMRAAGIPTRLASGLVSWDGTFYYHAWVEVWDGKAWYPIDSTSPDMQVSAAHVKLSEGNVEQAFSFPFLGSVKLKVLASHR